MRKIELGQSANLDFLRAVAVMLVVSDHLLAKFRIDELRGIKAQSLGHFGVLLFFVHTSLVLMYSLERSRLGGLALMANFHIRRIFRIYPLSVLAVIVTIALHLSSAGGHGLVWSPVPGWGRILSNLFLVQNLTRSDSILGVLWSLPLELQMYLLLPFFFLWIQRSSGKHAFWLLMVIWAGFAVAAHFQLRFHLAPRLSILGYIPNFLPGMIAFTVGSFLPDKTWVKSFLWPGFLAVLVSSYLLRPNVIMGWILCLTLGLAIPLFGEIATRWVRWISYHIAKYSYGIYIAHSFCVWIAFSLLVAKPLFMQVAAFVLTMVCLPILLYHGLEHPMIKAGSSIANRWTAKQESRPALEQESTAEVAAFPLAPGERTAK